MAQCFTKPTVPNAGNPALVLALGLALAVAGCGQGAERQPEVSTAKAPSSVASPSAPLRVPSSAACAPAPGLVKAPDFTPSAADFAKLEANFAAAYGHACDEKWLAHDPLVPAGAPHPGQLTVINAPDANVASIYRGGDDGKGDILLEYHFAGSDGSQSLPTADDLQEAIYCAVHAASEAEQDDSGRCLAD